MVGPHQWIASYSGDRKNAAITTKCGDGPVVVTNPMPSLSAVASPDSTMVGGSITDQASLSGVDSPTGTITFNLFLPGDTTCFSPIFTSTKTVNGDGTYTSDPVTTTTQGLFPGAAKLRSQHCRALELAEQLGALLLVLGVGDQALLV